MCFLVILHSQKDICVWTPLLILCIPPAMLYLMKIFFLLLKSLASLIHIFLFLTLVLILPSFFLNLHPLIPFLHLLPLHKSHLMSSFLLPKIFPLLILFHVYLVHLLLILLLVFLFLITFHLLHLLYLLLMLLFLIILYPLLIITLWLQDQNLVFISLRF